LTRPASRWDLSASPSMPISTATHLSRGQDVGVGRGPPVIEASLGDFLSKTKARATASFLSSSGEQTRVDNAMTRASISIAPTVRLATVDGGDAELFDDVNGFGSEKRRFAKEVTTLGKKRAGKVTECSDATEIGSSNKSYQSTSRFVQSIFPETALGKQCRPDRKLGLRRPSQSGAADSSVDCLFFFNTHRR
jgi:hypothetical protein